MTGTMQAVACPKCGGPMWDNRAKKTNPKAPDFKCKKKDECDGVIWPPKDGAPAYSSPPAAPAPRPTAPASAYVGDLPGDPGAGNEFGVLCAKYKECVQYVLGHVAPLMAKEIGTDPQAIASMAACVFIERNKRNV